MANLQTSTSSTLNVIGNIDAPKIFTNTYQSLEEWTGSAISIGANSSINLFSHVGANPWVRTPSICHFFVIIAGSIKYGIFSFEISAYGTTSNIIQTNASFTLGAAGSSPYYLVFNNTQANIGSFYFNIQTEKLDVVSSLYLTRVK